MDVMAMQPFWCGAGAAAVAALAACALFAAKRAIFRWLRRSAPEGDGRADM